MDAVAVTRMDRTPRVVDLPRPDPAPGEALVRVHRVGVDGTDHDVVAGDHGGFPPGDDRLVLGHEAVGVVVDPNDTALAAGQHVVPTVRRPVDDAAGHFARGQPDMAPAGDYVERGIEGAHGFMAEYVTSPGEYLVPVPDSLAPHGFLVEPLSVTEKALELAVGSRASFDWRPESALVAGNGSLGLLTLAVLAGDDRFERLYCLGRRDRPDPTVDVVERLGATYVDSRETPLPAVPDVHEGMDLVYEATGYARHGVEAARALAPNGVAALLGVPGDHEATVDVGSLHRDVVLSNKAIVGSVNARRHHFEAAVDALAALPEWVLDAIVTGVYGPDDLSAAFADDDRTIKTAVELSPREER
jgi:threonine dehydrogenase-like Zn-dependent dehydrogenase